MAMLLKLLPYIAIVVIILGSYTVGHIKGTTACQIKNAKQETTAIINDGVTHDKIEFKDSQLSDPDLDKLLSRWVRAK